ncbi:hypothetical protein KFK09_019156 [Dendrobium nobile]|uniref:Transcription factor TFIIIC triple barrel domain-containing protein n=1 Tax=Dendrobium nobile TaxID=94219 RepID=A0A8T3AY96_DENNO|nr:hypothetical protein KFK09_019156 [Dendrobium nobile]
MEANLEQGTQAENDEEYVLLDLENVCMQADIPANAPYTLSGLDTLNPTLTIGNRLKLIGEYQETIGTCYMFCERDAEAAVKNADIGSCSGNFPKNQQHTGGPNQSPCKQIRLVASTQKILKFRLQADVQAENIL